jgi:hypothetical protein
MSSFHSSSTHRGFHWMLFSCLLYFMSTEKPCSLFNSHRENLDLLFFILMKNISPSFVLETKMLDLIYWDKLWICWCCMVKLREHI